MMRFRPGRLDRRLLNAVAIEGVKAVCRLNDDLRNRKIAALVAKFLGARTRRGRLRDIGSATHCSMLLRNLGEQHHELGLHQKSRNRGQSPACSRAHPRFWLPAGQLHRIGILRASQDSHNKQHR